MVLQNPTAYVGKIVLWGGEIIETVNVQGGSEITVLETPLDYQERPESARYSRGRFIAKSSEFLDPAIYKKGQKITLAGEIVGNEIKPLGKTEYAYPVVMVKQLHLWKRVHYGRYSPCSGTVRIMGLITATGDTALIIGPINGAFTATSTRTILTQEMRIKIKLQGDALREFLGEELLMKNGLNAVTGSPLAAALLSAAIFSLGHGYEGSAGVITVGVMGLVFGFVYLWRQSLVAPIVMHFLQDFIGIVLVPLLVKG
jgi:hypothetical protein